MGKSNQLVIKLGFGLSFISLIYICCIGIKNVFRYNRFSAVHKSLLSQMENQQQLNYQYKKEILALKNERYLELIAKEKLQLILPGEKVYKFYKTP